MNNRRHFLAKSGLLAGLAAIAPGCLHTEGKIATVASREEWIALAEKLAGPVLENLAARKLRQNMPVEQRPGAGREAFSHLEVFGRLMSGLAPWLEQDRPAQWLKLSHQAIDAATDPDSPDFLNFNQGSQPLVDSAFLALAFLRAPSSLWEPLPERVKANVVSALKSSRVIRPHDCNWLLFAATVEACLQRMGQEIVRGRVARALEKHQEWYLGDGIYGDGPKFHADGYNSFVIHPMLIEVTQVFKDDPEWGKLADLTLKRAQRYAVIQERQIGPDGSYPLCGRSATYRCGAFHALALTALRRELPPSLKPAQVRCALAAAIRRQMNAPGTFDAQGWLQIGFCGHQPSLAESYVSTGSLYLCSNVLLPLGLPASDPFWADADAPWTAVKAWSGVDLPADHAMK
ncbi:MAG: hypothetical protein RL095_4127 [Verrucomicrobiota bacterium]|jgi:hypothetical protein